MKRVVPVKAETAEAKTAREVREAQAKADYEAQHGQGIHEPEAEEQIANPAGTAMLPVKPQGMVDGSFYPADGAQAAPGQAKPRGPKPAPAAAPAAPAAPATPSQSATSVL